MRRRLARASVNNTGRVDAKRKTLNGSKVLSIGAVRPERDDDGVWAGVVEDAFGDREEGLGAWVA